MKPIVVELEIQAAPALVFEVFTDLAHAQERVRSLEALEVLTPGPFGTGTRFRETRQRFGEPARATMEVHDFRPGAGYALVTESHGHRVRSDFAFESSGTGTRVQLTVEAEPLTAAARMMSSMLTLLAGSLRKALEEDLADLRQACEDLARSG